MTTATKKVILQEPVLAHYRKDVFATFASSRNPEILIVAGEEFEGIQKIKDGGYKTFPFFSFGTPGHRFYFLRGSISWILSKKPDAVICTGVDFHQLHSILLFIIQRLVLGKKFFWWSHATPGNQGATGRAARKFFYRKATGVLAYSRYGKEMLVTMGIDPSKICVVNNSLNVADYGFLNGDITKSAFKDPLKIVFCGRITPSKKLDMLIASLALLQREKSIAFDCEIIGGWRYFLPAKRGKKAGTG